MEVPFQIEGLEDLVANLEELTKATTRNAVIRTLRLAAEPMMLMAARLAPRDSGDLDFSIRVGTQLTRRHRGEKESQFEVYVGPSSGPGAPLNYAEEQEFGWRSGPAHPYMRPAWDSQKMVALEIISRELGKQIQAAATRRAAKLARAAGG